MMDKNTTSKYPLIPKPVRITLNQSDEQPADNTSLHTVNLSNSAQSLDKSLIGKPEYSQSGSENERDKTGMDFDSTQVT